MTDNWKDLFIGAILLIIVILATITLVDLFLVKGLNMNEGSIATIFGAVIGGFISGGLTLWGVKIGLGQEKTNNTHYRYLSNFDQLLEFDEWMESNEFYLEYLKSAIKDYARLEHICSEAKEYIKIWAKIDIQLAKMMKDYSVIIEFLDMSIAIYESEEADDDKVFSEEDILSHLSEAILIGDGIIKRKKEICD